MFPILYFAQKRRTEVFSMSASVFCRYEYKYLLTRQQHHAILDSIRSHMALDQYGHSTVFNIYYDTPSFSLIRASLDHPLYKEKLRLRSYGSSQETGFLELKKKYDGIVYKRRISLPYEDAYAAMLGSAPFPDCQIGHELRAAVKRYPGLRPTVSMQYEREAYYDRDGSDFRVTFDENIRCRWLSPVPEKTAHAILPTDTVLMELKLSQSIPLWMAHLLSQYGIQKSSFSKYGKAYTDLLGAPLEALRQIS